MKKIIGVFRKMGNMIKKKWVDIRENDEIEIRNLEKLEKEQSKRLNSLEKNEKYDWKFVIMFWIIWWFIMYISYIFFQSLSLIYLIFAAYIISIAMESIIEFFQKKLPRSVAVILTYLILLAFILSGFLLVVPFIINQAADIIKLVLQEIDKFQVSLQKEWIEQMVKSTKLIPGYLKNTIIYYLKDPQTVSAIQEWIEKNISQIVSVWNTFIKNVWYFLVNVIGSFFSALFQIWLVFILSIFFSLEKEWIIQFIDRISDKKWLLSTKIRKIYKKLWFRLKWQLLLSLYIGIVVWIVLETLSIPWIWIDLPNKFTLALIAGITEFVPMLGPILWAIPALLVAILAYWFKWFIWVLIAYYVIQWTENNILIPFVMNHALWISPLVIFIAMLVWWSVLWFVWIVLSVPIAVILTIVFEDIKNN